jgi:hypothetical protein
MSDVITKSRAATLARAAEAMLRALGGGDVVIRCPVAPADNSANGELGIAGPVTEELTVTPVVARTCMARASDPRLRLEFLFAAATLAPYLADRGESAEDFFAGALGIVHGQTLLHIETMSADSFGGTPYLYRVVAAES